MLSPSNSPSEGNPVDSNESLSGDNQERVVLSDISEENETSNSGTELDELSEAVQEHAEEESEVIHATKEECKKLKKGMVGLEDRSEELKGLTGGLSYFLKAAASENAENSDSESASESTENAEKMISDLEQSIQSTAEKVDEEFESNDINILFKNLKEAKTLGEKIQVLFSGLSHLIGGFLGVLGTGKGQESAKELIKYESLDFSEYNLNQMVGENNDKVTDHTQMPSLQEIYDGENPYSEGSVMHYIITKIQNTGSLTEKLGWTSAYTSARIFTEQKLAGNEGFDFDAYKQMRGYEKIKNTAKPGDMIIMGSGGGGWENNVLRTTGMGKEHIMMVGDDGKLFHSTMKKEDGNAGFEEVDMKKHLDGRSPMRLAIVRPSTNVNIRKMTEKARELVQLHEENPDEFGYSYWDAATSLVTSKTYGERNANCAKFVGLCLEAGGYEMPDDAGNPAAYFEGNGFSIEHFGTYVA